MSREPLVILPLLLLALPRVSPCDPAHPSFEDYCAVNASNTPCKYKCLRNDSACGPASTYQYQHLSNKDIDFVLRRHNGLRAAVAGGVYRQWGIPQAADMMVMSWDKQCEWMAACYIVQCTWAHDELRQPIHSQITEGQNLYRHTASTNSFSGDLVETLINSWFDEYKLLTNESIIKLLRNFDLPEDGPQIGHFTQFVWSATRYIGCAKYQFHAENKYQLFFFCNYYPSGNMKGERMFLAGTPATSCPEGTRRNRNFPNLCGTIRKRKDDLFVPPLDLDPEGTRRRLKEEEEKAVPSDEVRLPPGKGMGSRRTVDVGAVAGGLWVVWILS